ncbi:Ppx/GppA phosphatase family protein [Sessilibacter corallicola]|uniref:Ppx/GppA phosphatase family protein n=1 Tax=Sessilibacter corallicola TaxID=2904075 RepID=UPI001E563FF1|nr:Ppx/GppA phosphatase family protein [Sessilibacter corallicola]MCE2029948.1 Ppx/GppA family phosphatase [Sessilibacter corallicola]
MDVNVDITLNNETDHYYVAIDLGSNSFHMLIVRENRGLIEVVDRVKDMVQIARGLKNGVLSEEAQNRALECLQCFNERIQEIPAEHIKAVGTKALRAASNGPEFLYQAEKALGVPIQLVSGYEEARLVYVGVSNNISQDHQKRLVIDIGGASTEFIVGQDYSPRLLESLSIGCVTFTEKYLTNAKGELDITPKTLNNVYIAASEELEGIRSIYRSEGWDITYGASGTMKSVTEIMPIMTPAGIISREGVNELYRQLGENKEIKIDNVTKQRRFVMPAGIAILKAILDQLDIEELHVSDAALKEGLIHETIGRLKHHDIRDETVTKHIAKYHVDRSQAERVKHIALSLFQQLQPACVDGINCTSVLGWSALLHEIGLTISHSGYHHHGRYILENSDLAGFNRYEQYLLATLVGMHRRKINQNRIEALNPAHRDAILSMAICLRLATVLNRKRDDLEFPPSIAWTDKSITLTFETQWLENNPLTQRSLTQEAEYLSRIGITLNYY